MDSQPIGPTSGPAAAPQAPVRAASSAAAPKIDATKDAASTNTARPEETDTRTQQVVATIVDDGNRTVIRQIPDAEILRIAQAIDRMKGFLLEGKA